MINWEVIGLKPFEQSRGRTTVHIAHFITKFMSNTLSTMTISRDRDMHPLNSARAVLWYQKQYIICINAPRKEVTADGHCK